VIVSNFSFVIYGNLICKAIGLSVGNLTARVCMNYVDVIKAYLGLLFSVTVDVVTDRAYTVLQYV
jgi:hypothetical protein